MAKLIREVPPGRPECTRSRHLPLQKARPVHCFEPKEEGRHRVPMYGRSLQTRPVKAAMLVRLVQSEP